MNHIYVVEAYERFVSDYTFSNRGYYTTFDQARKDLERVFDALKSGSANGGKMICIKDIVNLNGIDGDPRYLSETHFVNGVDDPTYSLIFTIEKCDTNRLFLKLAWETE